MEDRKLWQLVQPAHFPKFAAAFVGDRRGTTVLTYALVFPIFLLLVFGAATVWRVVSIKQSLDVATYTAVRHLSREGQNLGYANVGKYDSYVWEQNAHREIDEYVRSQVRRNPFVGEEDDVQITIVPPVDADCLWYAPQNDARALNNIRFTVTTVLALRSPIQIPFLDRGEEPTTFTFTLTERHSDHVECSRLPPFRWPPEENDIF